MSAAVSWNPALDVRLAPKDAKPLIEVDIAWAVELAAASYQNRWTERSVREAETEAAALRIARDHCQHWGHLGDDGYLMGHAQGLEVKRHGRAGMVTFKTLVDRLRGPVDGAQLALFPYLTTT